MILIDGKRIEDTVWEFDGKSYPGDQAFKILALGSPLILPIAGASAIVGGLIGHYLIGKKKR